jgi:hypothetical protein
VLFAYDSFLPTHMAKTVKGILLFELYTKATSVASLSIHPLPH